MEICFKRKVYDELHYILKKVDYEWGVYLLGDVKEDLIIIDDYIMPKQESDFGSLDVSAEEKVLMRKKYGDKCLKIVGHLHSHGRINAFWSSTDLKHQIGHINTMSRNYGVFVVISKHNDKFVIKCKVFFKEPFFHQFDDVDYFIQNEINSEKLDKLIKENIEFVTIPNKISNKSKNKEKALFNGFVTQSDFDIKRYFNEGGYNDVVFYFDGNDKAIFTEITAIQLSQINDELLNGSYGDYIGNECIMDVKRVRNGLFDLIIKSKNGEDIYYLESYFNNIFCFIGD